MRALCRLVAVLLVLGPATAASAGQHERETALMQEVTRFGDDLTRAMLDDDVDRMMSMYVPDAISLPNFGPRMQGIDAFRQSHAQMSAAGMKVLAFSNEPTDVWQAGDQIIEIGTYKIAIEMPMPSGISKIDDHGKYLNVYERDAASALKLKVEIWNTDMNPMQMMSGMMGGQEGEPEAPPPPADREPPVDQDPEGDR